MDMSRCSVGWHRWTTTYDEAVIRCANCSAARRPAKAFRCHFGLHRWIGVRKDGGEPYRECIFCRKYGGSPKFFPGGSPST